MSYSPSGSTCSCMSSSWSAASFRAHSPAPVWGTPQTAVWISAPPWYRYRYLYRLQGNTCPTMVFSRGCRGIPAQAPGAPPPSLLLPLLILVLAGPFQTLRPSSLTAGQGFTLPYLDSSQVLPQQLLGWAVPTGGAVGAGWNQPCLAWGSPGHPSQRPPR